MWRNNRRHDVNLMRLRDQQAAVRGRLQSRTTASPKRDDDMIKRGRIDGDQLAAQHAAIGNIAGNEEQALKSGADPTECDGIHLGSGMEYALGMAEVIEFDDVSAPGPSRAPEAAVGREGEAVDAGIAEVLERMCNGIEDFNAIAG